MNPRISQKRRAKAMHAGSSSGGGGRMSFAGNGRSEHQQVNVGDAERQLSMIGGSILAAYGLLRRSFSGLALATIGAALIWRGHTGHCEVYHMLGHSSADSAEHVENGQHD